MKVQLESTSKIVTLDGVEHRIWEGETESGVPVFAFISRIGPSVKNPDQATCAEFERDLQEVRPPSPEVAAFPMRMIL